MRQLSSKNYKHIAIRFRGDEDTRFIMPRSTGDKLIAYLASNQSGKHVVLTDIDNYQKTVHTSEIISADPIYDSPTIDWTKFENYEEIEEAKRSHQTPRPLSNCQGERSINKELIRLATSQKKVKQLASKEWREAVKAKLWEQRQDWCDQEKGICFCAHNLALH